MFRKTMALCYLSLFAPAVWATPFDGFYAGADIGASQASFKKNQLVNLDVSILGTPIIDIPIGNKKNLSDTSILGNLDIGFSKVFKLLYLGVEANVDFQNIQVENAPALQEQVSNFTLPFETEVKLKNEFALTFNPGIVLNKTTLFYGKVGPAWGRFSVDGTANYSQTFGSPGPQATASTQFSDNNFYKCGLRLGVGIEQYVSEHMTLKLEFVSTDYGTIHSGTPTTGAVSVSEPGVDVTGLLSNSDQIKARNSSVLFGFNYRFG
jgi:opacity protein-like surface antigen